MKTVQEYRNDEIVVRFDPRICTHSGRCVSGLPAVFDVSRKPWVSVSAARADEIVRQIEQCPSGALSCERVGRP